MDQKPEFLNNNYKYKKICNINIINIIIRKITRKAENGKLNWKT